MVGFLLGGVTFVLTLGLGGVGIALSLQAERAEREGDAHLEIRLFRDIFDRLHLSQRLVVVGLASWAMVFSSPVWLALGVRSLLAG